MKIQPMFIFVAFLVSLLHDVVRATTSQSHPNPLANTNDLNMMQPFFSPVSDHNSRHRPCDSDIPASAYASQLIPRPTHHEAGTSCPFVYEANVDENRRPTTINEAKCSCVQCQLPRYLDYHHSNRYKCHPIYHMVPVMKLQDGDWALAMEKISVGCTCKRTRLCRRRRSRQLNS